MRLLMNFFVTVISTLHSKIKPFNKGFFNMYRRKTNVDSNSVPFPETKGITRHCQTCKQWKSTGGFRKHPFRGYMECKECVTKRAEKLKEKENESSN